MINADEREESQKDDANGQGEPREDGNKINNDAFPPELWRNAWRLYDLLVLKGAPLEDIATLKAFFRWVLKVIGVDHNTEKARSLAHTLRLKWQLPLDSNESLFHVMR